MPGDYHADGTRSTEMPRKPFGRRGRLPNMAKNTVKPKRALKTVPIQVTVTKEFAAAIRSRAIAEGMSLAELGRKAFQAYLANGA